MELVTLKIDKLKFIFDRDKKEKLLNQLNLVNPASFKSLQQVKEFILKQLDKEDSTYKTNYIKTEETIDRWVEAWKKACPELSKTVDDMDWVYKVLISLQEKINFTDTRSAMNISVLTGLIKSRTTYPRLKDNIKIWQSTLEANQKSLTETTSFKPVEKKQMPTVPVDKKKQMKVPEPRPPTPLINQPTNSNTHQGNLKKISESKKQKQEKERIERQEKQKQDRQRQNKAKIQIQKERAKQREKQQLQMQEQRKRRRQEARQEEEDQLNFRKQKTLIKSRRDQLKAIKKLLQQREDLKFDQASLSKISGFLKDQLTTYMTTIVQKVINLAYINDKTHKRFGDQFKYFSKQNQRKFIKFQKPFMERVHKVDYFKIQYPFKMKIYSQIRIHEQKQEENLLVQDTKKRKDHERQIMTYVRGVGYEFTKQQQYKQEQSGTDKLSIKLVNVQYFLETNSFYINSDILLKSYYL